MQKFRKFQILAVCHTRSACWNQNVTDPYIRHKIYISQLSNHARVKLFADFLHAAYMFLTLRSPAIRDSRPMHNWMSSFARLPFVRLLATLAIEEDCLRHRLDFRRFLESSPRRDGWTRERQSMSVT